MVTQALTFLEEEALGLKREPLSVEEISGDEKRVNVLADGQVYGSFERLARGVAKACADRFGAAREGGVQVDIGDVHETHGAN